MPNIINQLQAITIYKLVAEGYDKIADLRKQPIADNSTWATRAIALVFGAAAAFDGQTFLYGWNPSESTADNGGTIIKPTAITGNGRWIMLAGFVSPGGGCTPFASRHYGSGDPEGVVYGCIGDLYVDTGDGSTWTKESGDNTNTGWV